MLEKLIGGSCADTAPVAVYFTPKPATQKIEFPLT